MLRDSTFKLNTPSLTYILHINGYFHTPEKNKQTDLNCKEKPLYLVW